MNRETTISKQITYAIPSFTRKFNPINWMVVKNTAQQADKEYDDIDSSYVCCHQLSDGDDLAVLLPKFKQEGAKAVMLINANDDYICSQFVEGTGDVTTIIL